MATISSEIANNATYTAQYKAAQPRETGMAQKLTSEDFLNLMMQQLQYQDPLKPTDNAQFLAQQAQFSQVSSTQEMNEKITKYNSEMQASSLVGENVTLIDPNNSKQTITGKVTSATINGASSTITVGGYDFPLKYLKTVNGAAPATTTNTTTTTK